MAVISGHFCKALSAAVRASCNDLIVGGELVRAGLMGLNTNLAAIVPQMTTAEDLIFPDLHGAACQHGLSHPASRFVIMSVPNGAEN